MLDFLILEHQMVEVENIHMVGTTCLFMSSKIHEHNNIRMKDILTYILNDSRKKNAVLEMEMKILMKISNGEKTVPVITIFELFTEFFSSGSREQIN